MPVYVAHIGHYPTEVSDQTFQLRVTYTYPIAPCDVTPITASGQTSSYDPPTPVWLTWGGSDGTNCSRHDAQFFKRNGNGWADCDHWTEYDCSFVELHAGAEPTYAYCWSDDAQFTRTGSQCEVGAAEINIPWIDVDDTIGIVAASSSGTFPRRSGL